MKIVDCRVNHMVNPLGFAMDTLFFSWKIEDVQGKKTKRVHLVVIESGNPVYDSGLCEDVTNGLHVDIDLHPRTRYTWQVSVETDLNEKADSEINWFETGKMNEKWTGQWITMEDQRNPRHPVFYRSFLCRNNITSARLYITGLGLYEAYINGKRVGEERLTPYCNAYDQWIQVQTYDVTECLEEHNQIQVLLGNGWYRGRFGFDGANTNPAYGNTWKMICELHVTYVDGHEEVINSDESWKVKRSKIIFSNIYDGEQVDETLDDNTEEQTCLCNEESAPLQDRRSLPVTFHEEFPSRILHTPKGETVVDTGQNKAGIFRLCVHEPAGTRIHIQFGEVLQDDCFYRDNLRTAKAEYVLITDGSDQIVEPHFTFYGYRYAKIEGISDLKEEDFTAIAMYSDFPWIGALSTGNEKINQLISNTEWGMKSNYLDVPTDCPQRDERMGWTGDAQVFSPTAMYFADPYAFLSKYLYDMATEQKANNGQVPNVVPSFHVHGTSSVWGDATCIIPMNMYRFSGDETILKEHYAAMVSWVKYIKGIDGENHHWRDVFHFGDWLALDGAKGPEAVRGATDESFIADVYYRHSVLLCAEAARILHFDEEAAKFEKWAEKIKEGILEEFYTPSGRCAVETMTGMILSLHEGLGDKKKCAAKLMDLLAMNQGRLATGFVGTPLFCDILSSISRSDKAYDLLFNEEYPGWLHEVNLGATTIWERWNSLDDNGHITGISMNSLNHYSYGSVVEWIFSHAAGLTMKTPGFHTVLIQPEIDSRMKQIDLTYDSPYGKYHVFWKIIDRWHIHMEVSIPFDCEAEIHLPLTDQKENVNAGHYTYDYKTDEPAERLVNLKTIVKDAVKNPEIKAYLEKLPLFEQSEFSMQGLTLKEALASCHIEGEKELGKIENDLLSMQ